jgi:hypothetical protein
MEFFLFRFLTGLVRATYMNSEQVQLRVHGLGPLDCYYVTEDELDRIVRDGNDLGTDFALAQFGITIGGAFLADLLITPMALGKVYVTFVVIIVVGFLFGFAHAIKWYQHRGAFSATIRKIRDRQVGPLGEQGKEITPNDLNQLDSSASRPTQEGEPKS